MPASPAGTATRIYELNRSQWIPRSLKRVFPFCEKPENLALITPPCLDFEILSPTPVTMAAGCVIDYRICISGWPVLWAFRARQSI